MLRAALRAAQAQVAESPSPVDLAGAWNRTALVQDELQQARQEAAAASAGIHEAKEAQFEAEMAAARAAAGWADEVAVLRDVVHSGRHEQETMRAASRRASEAGTAALPRADRPSSAAAAAAPAAAAAGRGGLSGPVSPAGSSVSTSSASWGMPQLAAPWRAEELASALSQSAVPKEGGRRRAGRRRGGAPGLSATPSEGPSEAFSETTPPSSPPGSKLSSSMPSPKR